MTIASTDIKLLASERMTDTSDGGGRRTSNVIPDGVAGNIFPKVSRLDSVYGRVNLRKIYGAVSTVNLDTYAGAHAVIMDAPDNDKIHATLFSTGSEFDDRTAARDRIESYVIAGPEGRMVLYGRQLSGQAAITIYQRTEDTLPEAGDVFCLSKEAGGVTTYQQYIRVTDVTHELRMLEDDKGAFERRIVTLKLASPLRYEFNGPDTPSRFSNVARSTLVRLTNVADAAMYYGIQPVTEAAATNDLMVRVASVYTPIVPTTQRETPVANAELSGATTLMSTSASASGWVMIGALNGTSDGGGGYGVIQSRSFQLPRSVAPGTLQMRLSSYSGYDYTQSPVVTDDALGNIGAVNSSLRDILGGTIDYPTGTVTWTGRSGQQYGTLVWANYVPAAEVTQTSHTRDIPVTLASRGTVYVQTVNPLPAPGSLVVDFRALGKWYRLRDNGVGVVGGSDAAYGTGSIDYLTGTMVVTLGALPDVETSVLLAWGSPVHYTVRTTDASGVYLQFTLANTPLVPGSLVITYTSDAVYTLVESGGVVTGSGGITGTVDLRTGEVRLNVANKPPDLDSMMGVDYSYYAPILGNPPVVRTISALMEGGVIDTDGPLVAGTLRILAPVGSGTTLLLIDDGAGIISIAGGQRFGGTNPVTPAILGSVNYTTGVITLTTLAFTHFGRRWYTTYHTAPSSDGRGGMNNVTLVSGGSWQDAQWTNYILDGVMVTLSTRTGETGVSTPVVLSLSVPDDVPLMLDLTSTSTSPVVPGSVAFNFAGKTYYDRNGTLYCDVQNGGSTKIAGGSFDYINGDHLFVGAGTPAGALNYTTGEAQITFWADNIAHARAVKSCLTRHGAYTMTDASFRTSGSPVRPSSFYVQATAADGELLSGTADENGAVTGPKVRGVISVSTGVVWVQWGEMVTAAGNELESWYDAARIVSGQIWKPIAVVPSTISYSCVVLTNLPLNADILGLDPVRLPSDGRVPVYRAADVVVIHNTKSFTLPNPAVAGTTYLVGRTDLSELWVLDANGAIVATTHYAANLAAGTITMAADLALGATPQPLVARHRVEELNLLSDVQINGQLSLTGPLTRDFDTDTLVSSALLFGDMFARITGVFDQSTWDGVWSNSLRGAQATGQYNTVDYPITVFNNGAVTERWRINFTSSTAFQLIGENLGVIASGTTSADLTPTNPLTGLPYFTLRAAGWGAGWAAGNQLRFNSVGATAPIWISRTVLPGATLSGDSLDLQLRGDVDT